MFNDLYKVRVATAPKHKLRHSFSFSLINIHPPFSLHALRNHWKLPMHCAQPCLICLLYSFSHFRPPFLLFYISSVYIPFLKVSNICLGFSHFSSHSLNKSPHEKKIKQSLGGGKQKSCKYLISSTQTKRDKISTCYSYISLITISFLKSLI